MSADLANDPVQALLGQTALRHSLFLATSRYFGLEPLQITLDGKVVAYLPRRFLPLSDRFQTIQEHTVREGERLDHIAAQHLGDPTLFWRLCDANNAMQPEELTATPGRMLRITLPQDVAGTAL